MNAKSKEQPRPQKSFEELKKEIDDYTRERQPLYDLMASLKAQREAEHAAVLKLKARNEISKSDLVRIFREERAAIHDDVYAAQSALNECNDFFNEQAKPKKKTKRATPKTAQEADALDAFDLAIDSFTIAKFSVQPQLEFAARVMRRLNDIEQSIMKL